MPERTAKVFISYSHQDREWLDRLNVHLAPLRREGVLDIWDDTRLHVGDDWKEKIESAMASAEVCLLLVSADFLASDFVTEIELPTILEAAEKRNALIVPILLSACRFAQHPKLSRYQAKPGPKNPLAKLSKAEQEEILYELSIEIEEALQARKQNKLVEIEGKTGLKFVQIPAGTFQMGSGSEEIARLNKEFPSWKEWWDAEGPQHLVKLSSFHMSLHVVTVGQYKRYCEATGHSMPSEPSANKGWLKLDHPIVNVSWEDATRYCDWSGLSLPTEAEWEYACRGGLVGKEYPWGDDWNNGKHCANSVSRNSLRGTVKVGSYPANGYGLYDMVGNVWEWCLDWYVEDYYKSSPSTNPQGPSESAYKVLRGGSWLLNNPDNFRCAYRNRLRPTDRLDILGFRPVFH